MSTQAQTKKEQIISGLIDTRNRILDTASELSPVEQDQVFLGIWSVKDLLAHLVGWDYANLEAAGAVLEGELPGFYAYENRDWITYNARLVAEHKREDFEELIASAKASHHKLISFLQTIPAEEFERDRNVRFQRYKVTILRLLQAEMEDEERHYEQIKAFTNRSQ
jgi:uncharacterized damage-inducible protein DinB